MAPKFKEVHGVSDGSGYPLEVWAVGEGGAIWRMGQATAYRWQAVSISGASQYDLEGVWLTAADELADVDGRRDVFAWIAGGRHNPDGDPLSAVIIQARSKVTP